MKLVEQHIAQLLRGVDVELMPHGVVHALPDGVNLLAHLDGHRRECVGVDGDAVALHLDQHGNERHFQRVKGMPQAVLCEFVGEHIYEAVRHIGIRGGVVARLGDFHLVHRNLIAPLADDVLYGRHILFQHGERERFQPDRRARPAAQVRGNHRVKRNPHINVVVRQHGHIVVRVVRCQLHLARLE